jgi:hypothetical protein
MKYLKYFENNQYKDVDPFGEEDWDEDENISNDEIIESRKSIERIFYDKGFGKLRSFNIQMWDIYGNLYHEERYLDWRYNRDIIPFFQYVRKEENECDVYFNVSFRLKRPFYISNKNKFPKEYRIYIFIKKEDGNILYRISTDTGPVDSPSYKTLDELGGFIERSL